jgi:hypothetical protein
MPDGHNYENTLPHFGMLCNAIRDARYLGMIKPEAIIDRKNPPARVFYRPIEDCDASVSVSNGHIERHDYGTYYKPPEITFPVTLFGRPVRGQPCMIEIWVEKSTINDIVDPIGREFGVNVQTFTGEASSTACTNLIDRAIEAGRPVRILHIVDQDPAGDDMPVSAAVKVGFWLKKLAPDLDVQLHHICLTSDQCQEFNLPRTPIKPKDVRLAQFEERFGEGGGTELDALETLHHGTLREIIMEHIYRFHDPDLDSNLKDAIDEFEDTLVDADDEVEAEFDEAIVAWRMRRDAIASAFEEKVGKAKAKYDRFCSLARDRLQHFVDAAEDEIMEMENALVDDGEKLLKDMNERLEEIAPDPNEHEWPEPAVDDDGDDALFDSARGYVEQMDIFREHQGKRDDIRFACDIAVTKTCKYESCGKPFQTSTKKRVFCSKLCALNHWRKGARERKEA